MPYARLCLLALLAGSCLSGRPATTATMSYTFSTLSGRGRGYSNGSVQEAHWRTPEGIALDASGNVYVTEYWNNVVRKIDPEGKVTTLAGVVDSVGHLDGPGDRALFNRPHGLTVGPDGTVYVCDMKNGSVRSISPDGEVSTLATGLDQPEDVAIDSRGNLFLANTYDHTIYRIAPDGTSSLYAGKSRDSGYVDGPLQMARFSKTIGIAIDGKDNLYVLDANYDGEAVGNNVVRKITPAGVVSTVAGIPGRVGNADGPLGTNTLHKPVGIAATVDGQLFIADTEGDVIRHLDRRGHLRTIGGGYLEEALRDGPGTAARFADPQAIAVDRNGALYIADTFNHAIRKGEPQQN